LHLIHEVKLQCRTKYWYAWRVHSVFVSQRTVLLWKCLEQKALPGSWIVESWLRQNAGSSDDTFIRTWHLLLHRYTHASFDVWC
jgi:hypothetical protein